MIEQESNTVKPEALSRHDKVANVWDRKTELVKESKAECLEERGIHVGKKCFQVSASTPEAKGAKVRKCGVSGVWHATHVSLNLAFGDRGGEAYREILQLRQEGKHLQQMIWV